MTNTQLYCWVNYYHNYIIILLFIFGFIIMAVYTFTLRVNYRYHVSWAIYTQLYCWVNHYHNYIISLFICGLIITKWLFISSLYFLWAIYARVFIYICNIVCRHSYYKQLCHSIGTYDLILYIILIIHMNLYIFLFTWIINILNVQRDLIDLYHTIQMYLYTVWYLWIYIILLSYIHLLFVFTVY